jgi:DNA-binding response OmpR family regulator
MSKVLLIDDDTQINEVVKATLEMYGHEVQTAETSERGIELTADFQPNITVVDYALPGTSGIELLEELSKQQPQAVRLLATGMADLRMLKDALRAGASSMLCKPYSIADLVGLISWASLLEGAQAIENLPEEPVADELSFRCASSEKITVESLSRINAFVRHQNRQPELSQRILVASAELMKNASTHGAAGSEGDFFQISLRKTDDTFELRISNSGPAFDWSKTLARARSGIEKNRASGLQLVATLADQLRYENDGRMAVAHFKTKVGQ